LETLKAEFESNERLTEMYGELKTDKWSEGEIVVGECMIKAIGAGMKVRGLKYRDSRPGLAIVDDLENDELVQSQERREKLERWLNGALVPSLAEGGRIICIGTILHHDSLLSKMLSDEQYSEYEKRTYRAIQDGKPLWPEHKSIEDIEQLKREYTEKGLIDEFYREYMNQVISSENQKFKLEKFKYYEEEELERKMLKTFITIDRAYSTDKTADNTGIVVVSVDDQNIWYVRHAERFKGDDKQLIDKLFDLQAYWKPQHMGIEQKAYEHTLKPHMTDEMRRRNQFFVVECLKDNGTAKTLRIEGLVPRFENGSLLFKRTQTELIDELIQFPRSRWDDLSDALAYQLVLAEPVMLVQQKRQKEHVRITKYG
jgi:phage terminase large subunit-like protein